MQYTVFVEGRDIILIEAESKEQASIRALTQVWDEPCSLEWNAEIIEETE